MKFLIAAAFFCILNAGLLVDPDTGRMRARDIPPGVAVEESAEGMSITIDGHNGRLGYDLPLTPGKKFIRLKMKMRVTEVAPGEQSWQNGRMAMRFYGPDEQPRGPWPNVFSASGTTEFLHCERIYEIPDGATILKLNPANFGVSGKVEFRDLQLMELKDLSEADLDYTLPDELTIESLESLDDAWRAVTATRERISLNGLWQFRPELPEDEPGKLPEAGTGWGYFKVPGSWPVTPNGMEFHLSEPFKSRFNPAGLNSAYYRRTIAVPEHWQGRRILLDADLIQSCAKIFIDGAEAAELYYPGGEADLTGKLIPGKNHTLALLVTAIPGDGAVFMAPGRLVKTRGGMQNRGITGDLYLESRPMANTVSDVHVITSASGGTVTFSTGFHNMAPGAYRLEAEIFDGNECVKSFSSGIFRPGGIDAGRHAFGGEWSDAKLWDIDTPEHLYQVKLRLMTSEGILLDEFYPEEFGFREFTTDGRYFYLNGKKIFLRALASKTPQTAIYGSREWVDHLVDTAGEFGANFILGWNYSFRPGVFCYIDSFHRQTSKRGMLTSLTLPHFRDFNSNLQDPAEREAYRRQAEHLIRRFQNVPGVIMHVMNHNATGYMGDQNPERMGTAYQPEQFVAPDTLKPRRNAEIAERIAKELDPTRPVYHHESGNLGDVFTVNCYLNWAPRQERSDWLEVWEEKGEMPVFFVEWGIPHIASWSSFRGPAFIWSSAARQCLWLNEFNAAILGERAYRSDPGKIFLYDLQEELIKGNREIFFTRLGKDGVLNSIPDIDEIRTYYAKRNFRDMRARGISGLLPWDQNIFWKRESRGSETGLNTRRFEELKRPGIVPDVRLDAGEAIFNAVARFTYTPNGNEVRKHFQPCLAWIGGKPGDITEAGHNFRAGDPVEKSIVILNHGRREQKVKWSWSIPGTAMQDSGEASVPAGERHIVPVHFTVPARSSGGLELQAQISFEEGSQFLDAFALDVLPRPNVEIKSVTGVYDPEGTAARLLERVGLSAHPVTVENDLEGVGLLIVGRGALTGIPFRLEPYLRNGLKLLLLEQSTDELYRIGLRFTEHGFREVFSTGAAGFPDMRDWHGHATGLAPYLHLPAYELTNPQWNWNGIENTRVWRAGNRGSLTGVLIEKPAAGNWLPLLQCGFDLQYTPLLLFTEGQGMVLFCQLEVSGRTAAEPEAENIFAEALRLLDIASAAPVRRVRYTGGEEGRRLLGQLGIVFEPYAPEESLDDRHVLVAGPGAEGRDLIAAVKAGANILALGMSGSELELLLPGVFRTESGRHYADFVEGLAGHKEFAGITNSDLHWRGGMEFDAFPPDAAGGASVAIHKSGHGAAVAYQLPPWKFDADEFYLRTTRRRAAYTVSRLLANLGAEFRSELYSLFGGNSGNIDFQFPGSEWLGLADPQGIGREKGFFKPGYHPGREWRQVKVPGYFDDQFLDLTEYDGFFWYRLEFDIPADLCYSFAELFVGGVDDESWIWLNGEFLGEVTKASHPGDYWTFPRRYPLKEGALKPGRNVLVVLCNDTFNKGGITGTPRINFKTGSTFYADTPIPDDDPYRYYRW